MGPLNTLGPGVIVPPSWWPCVNCNINAAIKLQYAYNNALRTLFVQSTQPKYRTSSTNNIVVDIEVEYYCDNTTCQKGFISPKISIYFFINFDSNLTQT